MPFSNPLYSSTVVYRSLVYSLENIALDIVHHSRLSLLQAYQSSISVPTFISNYLQAGGYVANDAVLLLGAGGNTK